MMVEEFGTVVAIGSLERKRQRSLDGLDLADDALCALVPGGPALLAAGEDIGQGQAPDEITGQGVAATGHRVGFGQGTVLRLMVGQPQGQRDLQSLATQLVRGQPDPTQRLQELGVIVARFAVDTPGR